MLTENESGHFWWKHHYRYYKHAINDYDRIPVWKQ